MKKVCMSTMLSLIALVLASALTLSAFALSWSDAGTFSGANYHGNYSASIDVTPSEATMKLTISNYFGMVNPENGVQIVATAYFANGNQASRDDTQAGCTSYVWTIKPYNSSPISYVECKFYYMGYYITSQTVKAS